MSTERADGERRKVRRGPAGQRVLRRLSAIALAGVTVPVLARLTGWEAGPLAIAVALMPWVTVATFVPLILAAAARSRWLLTASAVVAALCLAWTAPLYVSQTAPAGGDGLVAATLNMTYGAGDPAQVVRMVRESHVDLLALQELTPQAVQALSAAGLDAELPYQEVHAEEGFTGTGLWSRTPLRDGRAVEGLTSRTVQAVVESATGPLTVVAAHPAAPGPVAHARWKQDLAALGDIVAGVNGPLIVLGDFNATRDHRGFRDLEEAGLIDAADQAGAGFAPTFPQGRWPFPVAAIDHVMVRAPSMVAVDTRSVVVDNADHRAVVVVYATQ